MNGLRAGVALALALWAGACVSSHDLSPEPVRPTPTSATTLGAGDPLPLDAAVRVGRLDNGLSYFVRRNPKPEDRAELRLVVNTGSLQEDDDQLGVAHFVEHMAFNGTRRFPRQELVDYLESIGMRFGPDLNAYTGFDETVYMLRVPTDDRALLATGLEILRDWADGIAFDEAEVDKERGVVLEEWRLGLGAQARLRDQQFPVLFKDSRYAVRLPIGEPEILERATSDLLVRFYRDWYRPELMAVIAVGDFDPEEIETQIRDRFAALEAPSDPRLREVYPVPEHVETLFAIATDPEATLTSVGVYYKLEKAPRGTVADYRRSIAERLYYGMLNARLDEIGQRADPPFLYAFAAAGSFVRSRDVYFLNAGVRDRDVERALAAVLTEAQRVDRHGFTSSELERAKKELLRDYERAYAERDKQDSRLYAGEYLRHFLDGEPSPGIEVELELVRHFLPALELTELNRFARARITDSNRVVLVSAPSSEASSLPDEEELLALFETVAESAVEPWIDRFVDRPLVADGPAAGPVLERRAIGTLGVSEWTLSNGVRVILKPTDFRNDEILLSGFSPGGQSLSPDDEATSARFAGSLVRAGGAGAFDQAELDKALAGEVATAEPYIGELYEGIRASASPEDAETMLQLVYLRLTAPRRDESAFESEMAKLRELARNRLARPENVFLDRVTTTLTQSHPRRRPLSEELLAEVDLDTALGFYRDRFGDAGDFTFIIVGSFDPEAIEPLVRTWLGGLPSHGRTETWRDVGVEPPAGARTVEVRQGLEPKSLVRLVFPADAEWSREGVYEIGSLAQALEIRLREVVREDRGATYGVSVRGSLTDRPRHRSLFTISFGCAPDQVEELVEALRGELDEARASGLAPAYIDKVKEIQRRQRQTDLKENRFWLWTLEYYYQHDLDPRDILAYDELVEGLTSERLQEAAARYLSPERWVLGVLFPGDDAASGTAAVEGSALPGRVAPSR